MEQVAAIWQDGSDEKSKFDRSIMVYSNSGRPQFIQAYYGCYDPLAYPILYPSGETGWKDKSILSEETPTLRFPRTKRKYTKRKVEGTTSTCPSRLLIVCNFFFIFLPVYCNAHLSA